jgi:hypothetical protein
MRGLSRGESEAKAAPLTGHELLEQRQHRFQGSGVARRPERLPVGPGDQPPPAVVPAALGHRPALRRRLQEIHLKASTRIVEADEPHTELVLPVSVTLRPVPQHERTERIVS